MKGIRGERESVRGKLPKPSNLGQKRKSHQMKWTIFIEIIMDDLKWTHFVTLTKNLWVGRFFSDRVSVKTCINIWSEYTAQRGKTLLTKHKCMSKYTHSANSTTTICLKWTWTFYSTWSGLVLSIYIGFAVYFLSQIQWKTCFMRVFLLLLLSLLGIQETKQIKRNKQTLIASIFQLLPVKSS